MAPPAQQIQHSTRRLLRSVVVQDQAGSVATRNLDCGLRRSAIEGKRHRVHAIALSCPLRSQPACKVLQAGLSCVNRDTVTKPIDIRARGNAQDMGSTIGQRRTVNRDDDAAAVTRD